MSKVRKFIEIKGIVQGVGFRPFVYNLAIKKNLKGWVNNSDIGVLIDVEGVDNEIDTFINEIRNNPPPLAKVNKINVKVREEKGYKEFSIKKSLNNFKATTFISQDYSICEECKSEILDIENRRYRYPFANCTNCGPRFTIIKQLPYDRKTTTMNRFEMCEECKAEYDDPFNRRFHAQPNGCSKCGPKAFLVNKYGDWVKCKEAITETVNLIKRGKIISVKGLGGFNLVCDSKNIEVINRLRLRKSRPSKPLALMMKDIYTIKKYCKLSYFEEAVILSNKRPILILDKLEGCNIPNEIAPNNKKLGVMLPYTPMHYLLFDESIDALVVTSANISGAPMVYTNDEAQNKLNDIVDYYLMHDRDIYISIDDSVCKVINEKNRVIRPGRGYSPNTINIETQEEILALGSELKNTIALTNKKDIFISPYIGDLKNVDITSNLENIIKHFVYIYKLNPTVLVYDLHPAFQYKNIDIKKIISSKNELNIIEVQHHHSHIVSCMAENNIYEEVIGIAFDGTGYGIDKSIWGGEFLLCTREKFKRVGHLKYMSLPGGESAIIEPWKIAISLLYETFKNDFENYIPDNLKDKNYNLINKMIDKNINSPQTSSIGRLFDGVAVLLGFNDRITFEGEAAIYLENISDDFETRSYNYCIDGRKDFFVLNYEEIIKGIIQDINNNVKKEIIAKKFHNTLIKSTIRILLYIRNRYKVNMVAVSGGVFQNEILFKGIVDGLMDNGFIVLTHKDIPCNDSGISFGQVIIANEILKQRDRELENLLK